MNTRPYVRFGHLVTLKDGREGEIVNLIRGADALVNKSEAEAIVLDSEMRIFFGGQWVSHYYEASVRIGDTFQIVVVNPSHVVSSRPHGG